MILQKDRPKDNDPYYNTPAAGGISTCIVISKAKPDTLPNCVAAAAGAFNKAVNGEAAPRITYLKYPPNAGQLWLNRALQEGLRVDKTPEAGAVAVWGNNSNKNTGHVAFIYAVDADGTIHTAESEYSGRLWVNRSYKPPYVYNNAKTFLGFIHLPAAVKKEHAALKQGSRGADVKYLQQLLIAAGYLRKGEADGDYGRITKGAVCCYQLENGLTVDGVCGKQTWAKIDP